MTNPYRKPKTNFTPQQPAADLPWIAAAKANGIQQALDKKAAAKQEAKEQSAKIRLALDALSPTSEDWSLETGTGIIGSDSPFTETKEE